MRMEDDDHAQNTDKQDVPVVLNLSDPRVKMRYPRVHSIESSVPAFHYIPHLNMDIMYIIELCVHAIEA